MGNGGSNELLNSIRGLKAGMDEKTAKRLDLYLLERIIKRLDSFSNEFEECRKNLMELKEHINRLKGKQGKFDKKDFKENSTKIYKMISHLQNKHKLVTEGYYMSIFMCLGMSIGIVFGLAIFKNIDIGMPMGICFGTLLGICLDADAKKKGKII